jgi:diguanylate cyclase (GGDEF)-like protein/PAS domain S-box-containing protein
VLRRVGLRTQLLVVVLVPMVGLVGVAGVGAGHRFREAARADDALHRIELAVAIGDVLLLTQIQTAIDLAGTDGQGDGASAGLEAGLIGSRLAASRARLAEVAQEIDELTTVGTYARITAGLDLLDRYRAQAAEGGSSVDDGIDADAQATSTLKLVLLDISAPDGLAGPTLPLLVAVQHEQLAEAARLLVEWMATGRTTAPTSGEDALADSVYPLLASMIPAPLEPQLEAMEAAEARWAAYVASLAERTAEDVDAVGAEGVQLALGRLSTFVILRNDVAAWFEAEAARTAHSAQADARTAMVGVGLLVLVTAGLALLVVGSITARVRRLEAGARRVATGDLAVEPYGPGGRDELSVLGATFDDMVSTLRLVEGQMAALARGEVADPVLRDVLPGPLGRSVRGSIHQLRETTEQLHASESRARAVVESAPEAIWSVGGGGRIRSANPAAATLVGRSVDEMVGRPITGILPARLFEADGDGGWLPVSSTEVVVQAVDGRRVPVLVSTGAVADSRDERLTVVFARDISDRKNLEQRLEHDASHDALTGLPNRASLISRLEEVSATAARARSGYALLFIDLDRFKSVNDVWGHHVGDGLLMAVAGRLMANVRPHDVVARLGGDEFVVLLSSVGSREGAMRVAERVLKVLSEPATLGGEEVRVTASVGLVWSDESSDAPGDLLRDADVAMYKAKANGRSRIVVFDDEAKRWAAERSDLERALHGALERGELEAHYQPLYDLPSGRMRGVELLARWNRPDHGPVSPARFIPIAEESGLIIGVGRWALREAARQAARWRRDGHRLEINVNVSGSHLTSGDLSRDVAAVLADYPSLSPEDLVLEVTETFLLQDIEAALAELQAVRDQGVRLAIDDFGTGYSSLTYLRTFPVSVVKVDRSFVSRMDGDMEDATIVRTVVNLAHSLGLSVVAEGVETPAQLELLTAMGCDHAQGYLLGRPVPAEELPVLDRPVEPR